MAHTDFAHVHHVKGMSIFAPDSVKDLQKFLCDNSRPIAVKGAGYSHGGQTLADDGVQIDMQNLCGIQYDPRGQTVTVMAGTTWYEVIKTLSSHGRTVAEMQSYYNFSVGGSISVNCHGRGMDFGAVSDTVVDLTVLTADGVLLKSYAIEQ